MKAGEGSQKRCWKTARPPKRCAVTHYARQYPARRQHQGPFVASTVSFNLAPVVSLSDAVAAINLVTAKLGVPTTIHRAASLRGDFDSGDAVSCM